ncbi:LytTR family DNA-binding domain-containing protein [Alishewanella sp. 16-MA]|uniref:LytTR family DNA-binding domain-containing protein n=1 Tax=Alishewanella maricola TaxID=2795740 RepID=A0ABS8C432_9ALTE|nr:LytTR family DNA-binding domain-containing protein [Alishewanella maricola]MCB5227086.1 LytTR family DNA-binding domain-containing protein [Alishewanella maricola]
MKVLIVDDEPLARSRLQRLLKPINQVSCVGAAEHAAQAWEMIGTLQPDVVLLDIDMPGEDGLSLAARIAELALPPALVFVTAHPEHALKAYQVSAADYLLKPVVPERLQQTLTKVGALTRAHIERQHGTETKLAYQCGNVTKTVPLAQVYYFVADSKYVKAIFEHGEAYLDLSLAELEQRYTQLLRIHRSYLINPQYFSALKQHAGQYVIQLSSCAESLPVSRRALTQVKHALQLD